jgi:predicted transcriptional regulator
MKTKKGFNLRTVCGENIIVAEGLDNIDFSRIINLNESAAFLWKNIQEKDFDVDALTSLLTAEYDVDEQTAHQDVVKLIDEWDKAGLIDKDN